MINDEDDDDINNNNNNNYKGTVVNWWDVSLKTINSLKLRVQSL